MKRFITYLAIVLAAAFLPSCEENPCYSWGSDIPYSGRTKERPEMAETRRVVLLYSIGFNSVSSFLAADIQELTENYLPGPRRNDDVFLVLSHQPSSPSKYNVPTSPVLIRMYKSFEGKAVCDTVYRWPAETACTEGDFTADMLRYIKDHYPAAGYGMVFSSHGTGWLPPCYTVNGSKSKGPSYSIGNEYHDNEYTEIDIKDFAAAFPMKFDYILLDACLMGGVEVAYELKDVCDYIGFSQTEIMADGYKYDTLVETLIPAHKPGNPEKVCRDYFEQYINSKSSPCATVSYIDCRKLGELAEACSGIFASTRAKLDKLEEYDVQGFYQYGWHWFFDLRDVCVKAGADAASLAKLDAALAGCVLYTDHTKRFLNITIETDCGFSMYLPSEGNRVLTNYYKDLAWNKATGLVPEN